ncbi:MAG: DNA-protecting protein DprA [Deltaproteobacteria bacterium]|nr:DNA-protecting protein DprA [Deltaproteobacteria bacterium]
MDDLLLRPSDASYPPALLTLAKPPDPLYVRGALPADGRLVAIVGTRAASPQGLVFAERLAEDLVRLGIGVISGGARGIDGAAHEGALRAGGHTTVVVATGLDVPYPREHAPLFDRVTASGGCLMSERAPGSQPTPPAFPSRNRIVAALAACTVVVEAPVRSGALSTARAVLRLGKAVLAVPGRPDDPRVGGCIELLRRGAHVCAGVRDVLDVLARPKMFVPAPSAASASDVSRRDPPARRRGSSHTVAPSTEPAGPTDVPAQIPACASEPRRRSAETQHAPGSDHDERTVLEMLGSRPVAFDDLCARSGIGAARIRATLSLLGLAGLVRESAGDCFSRTDLGGREA